ncbi:MAG: hypothetical protein IPN33_08910 [Saprospiraceae bacterium]|nr:hypothetical protein [Saprospiraceae bacterium]
MQHEAGAEIALLYLFIVAALGSWLGNIKYRGSGMGVAAVLFVGLAAGAIRPDIQIPKIITLLGLAVFVYSIGLSSGPSFLVPCKSGAPRTWVLPWWHWLFCRSLRLFSICCFSLMPRHRRVCFQGLLQTPLPWRDCLTPFKNKAPRAPMHNRKMP